VILRKLCWFYSLSDLPTHGRVARRRRAAQGPLLESPAHRGALQASSGTRQAGLAGCSVPLSALKGVPLVSFSLCSTSNHPCDPTRLQSCQRHLDEAFSTNASSSQDIAIEPHHHRGQTQLGNFFVSAHSSPTRTCLRAPLQLSTLRRIARTSQSNAFRAPCAQ